MPEEADIPTSSEQTGSEQTGSEQTGAEEPGVWEVRLGVFATRRQAEEVKARVAALLCPDPEHAPPCPVPWSVALLHGSDLDDPEAYEELVEQARIERALTERGAVGDAP